MKKFYTTIIVVFGILLLLPFSVQTVADLRGEKRFVSFDIAKDFFYTPLAREFRLVLGAQKLEAAWRGARESMAEGASSSVALEPVIGALSDLESVVLWVNSYAELDRGEADYRMLQDADTLLSALEDEPENFKQVDSSLKAVVANFKNFSLSRAIGGVKKYGAWSSRYLRAFEKKVEGENVLVLALRPKYQLAVWKIFSDPGEKVVLGSDCEECERPGRWLFYRQDVDFLVQPSPLDVRAAKLDNPIEAIVRFRDQLKQKGVDLLVVVVPGKPSIYPERLTGGKIGNSGEALAESVPKFGHGKVILDSLVSLGMLTVDLYTPLWKAKSDDEKRGPLYLDDDTHWTPRGAELAAQVVSRQVQQFAAQGLLEVGDSMARYVSSDSVVDRMGDIGEMSGLNKFDVFKAQQVTGHVVYEEKVTALDSVTSDTSKVPFKDDFRKSKILILGDSFSRIYQTDAPVNAGWIAHFAKNMNMPVASIVSDGGASTLVREKLARKSSVLKGKKLLIWEFVERDLRFGAEGWKNVDF